MKFAVTIDAEEDSWGGFRAGQYPVTNIDRIPELQEVFDEYGARPTYLITYPVATSESSKRILRQIQDSGRAEIGSHCHPWNTPPIEEELGDRSSMLCNLPTALQYKKLETLTEVILKEFGRRPVSFRAGRWAISGEVAAHLSALGYKVDSSVTPYADWSRERGPDLLGISYRDGWRSISEVLPGAPCDLAEIPPSIGFLQRRFDIAGWAYRVMCRSRISTSLRLHGLCYRLQLVNRVWLSPELQTAAELRGLVKQLVAHRSRLLNVTFHSPTLVPGLTPFVSTEKQARGLLGKIRMLLDLFSDSKIANVTLAEAASGALG